MSYLQTLLLSCTWIFVASADAPAPHTGNLRGARPFTACPGCHQCAEEHEQCSSDQPCCDPDARCESVLGGSGAQCVKQNPVIATPLLQLGHKYRLMNSRFGQQVCLDRHVESGAVNAYPCTGNGGDEWVVEASIDSATIRLKNYRFDTVACLDRHLKFAAQSVGAYPCDNNGGDEWSVEVLGAGNAVRLMNDRFGTRVCLDHAAENTVEANPCDENGPSENGGDEWVVEEIFTATMESTAPEQALLGSAGDVKQNPVIATPLLQLGHKYRLMNSRFGQQMCLDRHVESGAVSAYPCTGNSDNEWVVEASIDSATIRLKNYRFETIACLDRHLKWAAKSVGAYPCDNNGGDEWSVEVVGAGNAVRLMNDRFGTRVCLDHAAENTVEANPCDENGGDEWVVEEIHY